MHSPRLGRLVGVVADLMRPSNSRARRRLSELTPSGCAQPHGAFPAESEPHAWFFQYTRAPMKNFDSALFGAILLLGTVLVPACGDSGGTEAGNETDTGSGDGDGDTGDGDGDTGDGDGDGEPGDGDGDATCTTDICATYGAAVPAVAGMIVDTAAADPLFMDDFAPLVAEGQPAVDAFKLSLANFISDAYGCTSGAYTGPSMEAAHAGQGITQEDYDAFIGLIAGVLAGAGVPESDITLCFAPPLVDPAFAATIIGQ